VYRTTSIDVLLLISDIPPIDLLALERTEVEEARRNGKHLGIAKAEARTTLENKWQDRWSNTEKEEWTRKLIPDLRPWLRRKHGEITYHLTQDLTGHGCFPAYLNRFGLLQSAECCFCGHHTDYSHHTLFKCDTWHQKRRILHSEIGDITSDNMESNMMVSKSKWKMVEDFVTEITKKKDDERKTNRNQYKLQYRSKTISRGIEPPKQF
jgi:hypothetical protein